MRARAQQILQRTMLNTTFSALCVHIVWFMILHATVCFKPSRARVHSARLVPKNRQCTTLILMFSTQDVLVVWCVILHATVSFRARPGAHVSYRFS